MKRLRIFFLEKLKKKLLKNSEETFPLKKSEYFLFLENKYQENKGLTFFGNWFYIAIDIDL